jgi:hypothetical protein
MISSGPRISIPQLETWLTPGGFKHACWHANSIDSCHIACQDLSGCESRLHKCRMQHAWNEILYIHMLSTIWMESGSFQKCTCYEMLRDATSTKRPRIPGNSGEIQGFPVFPALPLIDLQGSASKIHWHYRHYGHYFLKMDPRENVSFKATTHKVWFMQIKQGLQLEKIWSNDVKHTVYLKLLKCDAIYPHSSSLPQVFTATVCACGCCGCYISAGRWSARDPTDATNPITLGEVVMAGRGHSNTGQKRQMDTWWYMDYSKKFQNMGGVMRDLGSVFM